MSIFAKKRRRKWRRFFTLLIIIIALLLIDSNVRLVTKEYELEFDDLPRSFDGFRIVQLSDVHAVDFRDDYARVIEAVTSAEPDVIVLTGDFIDSDDQCEHLLPLLNALPRIAPTYYVTGNHEWDSGGLDELLDVLSDANVTVLHNEFVQLRSGGDFIVLAGAEDPNGPFDMTTPEELVSEIKSSCGDAFTIMLNHRNDRLGLYSSLGVDLVLSGHAHGGIIRLPFTDGLIGPSREWFPTFTSGVYSEGDTYMVVSRGVGNHTGFPRFLNNPHIPVIILRSA